MADSPGASLRLRQKGAAPSRLCRRIDLRRPSARGAKVDATATAEGAKDPQ